MAKHVLPTAHQSFAHKCCGGLLLTKPSLLNARQSFAKCCHAWLLMAKSCFVTARESSADYQHCNRRQLGLSSAVECSIKAYVTKPNWRTVWYKYTQTKIDPYIKKSTWAHTIKHNKNSAQLHLFGSPTNRKVRWWEHKQTQSFGSTRLPAAVGAWEHWDYARLSEMKRKREWTTKVARFLRIR